MLRSIIFYIVVAIVITMTSSWLFDSSSEKPRAYSDIVSEFKNENVKGFTVDSENVIELTLKDDSKVTYKLANISIFYSDLGETIAQQAENGILETYDYEPAKEPSFFVSMLPYIIEILLFVGIFMFMMNMMGGRDNKAMSFGKSRAKLSDDKNKKTFADVAGADEEKAELEEIVDFLKSPAKYTEMGARVPKGILLYGPPGTGKTLLAKAVAGEAGVPFFSISGSDFVEMFVGVGASRVRDLFEQAKKNLPCIVFIDEIDAVGRHRGAGLGGGHDEREQTLNQLLVEMDGFATNSGIIIIAATNRPDILDPALLRPGRFDRQITISAPDATGREAILKVHARGKPIAEDVDFKTIAHGTGGFTGADLENLLNEAALSAVRNNSKVITMKDIEDSIVKVMVGPEKKKRKITEKENRLTAYHEGGHAILGHYLETQDSVHEISIIPRGGAGGYTLSIPEEEKWYATKTEMTEDIISLLGGRAAEEIILGDISTGASNDIQRATNIAKNMVTKYGMSEKLGPISLGSQHEEVFLGRDYNDMKNMSDATASLIDTETRRIIDESYSKAKEMLLNHKDELEAVAQALLKYEKLDAKQFVSVIEGKDPMETTEE
ncbi:MAG: ATP-dependent zinc metalloprotease FtsH [Clostridia bacterium]|nr:ATP-dependent zinc metalloprotease FtsH [Clostridia bacterium]